METFNQDPKPGRLILPLVLIGMIATTYTFINRVADNNQLEIIKTNFTKLDDLLAFKFTLDFFNELQVYD